MVLNLSPRMPFPGSPDLPQQNSAESLSQDLLSRAHFLRRQGRQAEAMDLYAQISSRREREEGALQAIGARATQYLGAMRGDSGLSEVRLNILTEQLVDQILDPVLLGAMTGAGATFRLSRAGFLGAGTRLGLQSPGWNLAANLMAFSLEATAFPALIRSGRFLKGESLDNSAAAWAHDIASSFLVLGGLKAFGLGGRQALQQLGGVRAPRSLQALVPQVAMYLGIISGRQGEQWMGLMPEIGGAQLAAESLVTWIHFNGAGRILGALPRAGEGQGRHHDSSASQGRFQQWATETGVVRRTGRPSASQGRGPREGARQHILMMSGQEGEGNRASPTPVWNTEVSEQVRSLGARYLGDLLINDGSVIWFVPAGEAQRLGLSEQLKTNLAWSGFSFREGVPDQVEFQFVYGGADGMDIPSRIDYVFELSEVVQKGMLLPGEGGRYVRNPQHRYFQMVWDHQLSPDPHGPSRESLRQRSRTFLTSEIEGGKPSTPPPPAPPVVEAARHEELPFSVAARVAAHPFIQGQRPIAIQGMHFSPVRAGGERMLWIQLGRAGRESGGAGGAGSKPRFVLLSDADAQSIGLLKWSDNDFQIQSEIENLYVEFRSRPQESRERQSIEQTERRMAHTMRILEEGISATRETSLDSAREEVFLLNPRLAEATGMGENLGTNFELEIMPPTPGLEGRVWLHFDGNGADTPGRLRYFTTISLPLEAAQRLLLVRRNAAGNWAPYPEPWPIHVIAANRLEVPIDVEVDLPVAGVVEQSGQLRVLTQLSQLSDTGAAAATPVELVSFTKERVQEDGQNHHLFHFFTAEESPTLPNLPLAGGGGFSLRAQDALDLGLIRIAESGGFELHPDNRMVWVLPVEAQ